MELKGRQYSKWRSDPKNFINEAPPDLVVQESLSQGAGKGLFTSRNFGTREFIINYRGDIIQGEANDSVYIFDSGAPDHVLIDATSRLDCLARFINDCDWQFKANCRPVKVNLGNKKFSIAFFTTQKILKGDELRYNYGTVDAPWKLKPKITEEEQNVINILTGLKKAINGDNDPELSLQTGQEANVDNGPCSSAQAALFVQTGQEANVDIGPCSSAQAAVFVQTGQEANVDIGPCSSAQAAVFVQTGQEANVDIGPCSSAQAAVFVQTGHEANVGFGSNLFARTDLPEQRDISELGNEFDSFEMGDLPFSIDDVDVNEMNLNASNSTSIQEQSVQPEHSMIPPKGEFRNSHSIATANPLNDNGE